MLSTGNHDRDVAGLTYVYPVVSRRAGGVSVGINLNPNNKCNWHCVYCQVPNLGKGGAPAADLMLLKEELNHFLDMLLHGTYMTEHVPDDCRKLCDIAISGNGEPTTCPNFDAVISLIVEIMKQRQLQIPLRLITNGSGVHKQVVQAGLKLMGENNGEVWFKIDAIGKELTEQINGVQLSAEWQKKQLSICAATCPTWIQTCVLKQQFENETFEGDYLGWLFDALESGTKLEGVLLYGMARPSMQTGGDALRSADNVQLTGFAQKIESLAIMTKVF